MPGRDPVCVACVLKTHAPDSAGTSPAANGNFIEFQASRSLFGGCRGEGVPRDGKAAGNFFRIRPV